MQKLIATHNPQLVASCDFKNKKNLKLYEFLKGYLLEINFGQYFKDDEFETIVDQCRLFQN